MSAPAKTIVTVEKLGHVYFPDRPEWGSAARQRWLRARKFRAQWKDVCYLRRIGVTGEFPNLRHHIVYAATLNVVTSKRQIPQRFSGEYLATSTKVSADALLAAYDLLWERFVACGYNKTGLGLDIVRPELFLKDTRRGRAQWGGGVGRRFSVPRWALNTCEDYAVYYTAHELAHHALGGISHGPTMRAVEGALLAPFDIAIEYNIGAGSAYPNRLLSISTGRVLHAKKTLAK